MEIFRCTVCGHEYDPRKGEIIQGVEPNTPFEELPRDWTCPVCGAVKDAFRRVTE